MAWLPYILIPLAAVGAYATGWIIAMVEIKWEERKELKLQAELKVWPCKWDS